MKNIKYLVLLIIIGFQSCISTKSTLKNVDNTAAKPLILDNAFLISEKGLDGKYGINKDYPINIGFDNETMSSKNIDLYFNALQGENGEKLTYKKTDDCCPFPTKRSFMGAGLLNVYQVLLEGTDKKINLYFNIYDKGKILCPDGFSIKKK